MGREERLGDGYMRDQDGKVGGRREKESNERDILIEGSLWDYGETQCCVNSLEYTRMTPGKSLSNSEREFELALSCNQIGNYHNCHHKTFN